MIPPQNSNLRNATFDKMFPNQIKYIYSSHAARLGYPIRPCWGPRGAREAVGITCGPTFWGGACRRAHGPSCVFAPTWGSAAARASCSSGLRGSLLNQAVGSSSLSSSSYNHPFLPVRHSIETKFNKLFCPNRGWALLRCLLRSPCLSGQPPQAQFLKRTREAHLSDKCFVVLIAPSPPTAEAPLLEQTRSCP